MLACLPAFYSANPRYSGLKKYDDLIFSLDDYIKRTTSGDSLFDTVIMNLLYVLLIAVPVSDVFASTTFTVIAGADVLLHKRADPSSIKELHREARDRAFADRMEAKQQALTARLEAKGQALTARFNARAEKKRAEMLIRAEERRVRSDARFADRNREGADSECHTRPRVKSI